MKLITDKIYMYDWSIFISTRLFQQSQNLIKLEKKVMNSNWGSGDHMEGRTDLVGGNFYPFPLDQGTHPVRTALFLIQAYLGQGEEVPVSRQVECVVCINV